MSRCPHLKDCQDCSDRIEKETAGLKSEFDALGKENDCLRLSTHCSFCDFATPIDVDSEIIAKK